MERGRNALAEVVDAARMNLGYTADRLAQAMEA